MTARFPPQKSRYPMGTTALDQHREDNAGSDALDGRRSGDRRARRREHLLPGGDDHRPGGGQGHAGPPPPADRHHGRPAAPHRDLQPAEHPRGRPARRWRQRCGVHRGARPRHVRGAPLGHLRRTLLLPALRARPRPGARRPAVSPPTPAACCAPARSVHRAHRARDAHRHRAGDDVGGPGLEASFRPARARRTTSSTWRRRARSTRG